jgi:Nuclease-related domain
MPSRALTLRRSDVCCACGRSLAAGAYAYWDARARTVTCMGCLEPAYAGREQAPPPQVEASPPRAPRPSQAPPELALPAELDRGHAGASAEREYRRRRENREAHTRERHPVIGGLLLALRTPPQHELAFHQGGRGEQAIARALEQRTAGKPALLLHDRSMPRGYGNIDHLAIAPQGVFVVDAKAIRGKVRISHRLFGEPRLLVRGRHRPKLLEGLDRQVAAVRQALAGGGHGEVRVAGVLCFTKAELPLFGREVRGHRLLHHRGLARRLNGPGPLSAESIQELARLLAQAFPAA